MGIFDNLWKQASNNDESNLPTNHLYYEIAHLVQGTDEWREWRRRVIGASDAPVIMNENPWSSKNGLLEEKLGLKREFQGNAVTREGNILEDRARLLLQEELCLELFPSVVQHRSVPYFAASLDAIDKEHRYVFEIKCGAKAYEIAKNSKEIPRYYFGQLQHILMVTQLDYITYATYRPHSKLIKIKVGRDETYITKLGQTEHSFVEHLVKRGHRLQKDFLGKPISR